jgi:putative chitinase
MAIDTRSRGKLPTPGPFLAEVTNLLDPTYMGSLEVAIIKGIPNSVMSQGETYIVRYLNPFYGVTSSRFEGNNSGDFNDVQKSYGMWMVPPDVGTTVMVIFIDGDPNQGYWMGCVQDMFQNHMVPGIAASKQTILTPEQERKYGTTYLPVAEYNKSTQRLENTNVERIGKPVHPFADRLLAQGLLLDTVRGVTSSSARREVPSSVFGISTPGPVDTSINAKRGEIGYDRKIRIPVSRLGGSTFVMDDGDVNGQNELVRIRTRTGHQILMHNSHDLIYIANSKGTAWVELTSNGKIDIYARDSVSIHTEQDFNFRADRDVNIEAGRNINMNAYGGMEINSVDRFYLVCGDNGKLQFGGEYNLTVGSDLKIQAGATSNIISEGGMRLNSGANISLGAAGNVLLTGADVHFNGPAAEVANAPTQPTQLEKFNLPNRSPSSGWANGNFFKSSSITSIMQRVPTHEPWDHHENINPSRFSPSSTDISVKRSGDLKSSPTAPISADSPVPVNTDPVELPASKSAASNEAYLQATLIAGGVTDPVKLAAWMAQCKVESGGFVHLKELGGDSYFAKYDGRADLGNTQPGDGAKFKGRGFIQLTGRDVYAKISKSLGQDFVNSPDKLESLEWAAKSVLYFFNVYKRGFKNRYMDKPATDPTFDWSDQRQVTGLVNGGLNHLANRTQYYNEYLAKFREKGIQPEGYVGTGGNGILNDSNGNPVKTGA